jgi:DNA-binding MarR family transcriptional regulator
MMCGVAGLDRGVLASELRVVLGQLVRRMQAEHRFPLMHGAVLGRLEQRGPLTTTDLAAAERVTTQSMGQTIRELESQSLVRRRADPADRRRMLLEVTRSGKQKLAEDRRRREGWLAQAIEDGFTEAEREALGRAVALLTKLAEL